MRYTFRSLTMFSGIFGTGLFGSFLVLVATRPPIIYTLGVMMAILFGLLSLGVCISAILQCSFASITIEGSQIARVTGLRKRQERPLDSIKRFERDRSGSGRRLASGTINFKDGKKWYVPPGLDDFDGFFHHALLHGTSAQDSALSDA